MRKHPERGRLLESPYAEPFEDHLEAAPIRPGDSVIVRKEVFGRSIACLQDQAAEPETSRVEPRYDRP